MTKLFIFKSVVFIIGFIFLNHNAYSQNNILHIPSYYLNGIKYNTILYSDYVDSNNIFCTIQKTSGKTEVYHIELDLNNGTHTSNLMDISSFEAYNNVGNKSLSINGKIYQFRSKRVNSETLYYKDEYSSNKIIKSKHPFFTGKIADGYIGVYKIDLVNGEIRLLNKSISSSARLKNIKYTFFDIHEFKVTNSGGLNFSEDENLYFDDITMKEIQDKVFFILKRENQKFVSQFMVLDSYELKLIKNDNISWLDGFEIFTLNNEFYLYCINRNPNQWLTTLYKFDLIDNNLFSYSEIITKDSEIDNIDSKSSMNANPILVSLTSDSYLLGKENYFVSIMKIKYLDSKGLEGIHFGSVIISKMVNNELLWAQFIPRSRRGFDTHYSNFRLLFNDENIVIADLENLKRLDDEGNFTTNGMNGVFSSSFDKINTIIDMESGNFKREVIK